MAFLEISARLGACLFLVWCLLGEQRGRAAWSRSSAVLACIAWGFGILSDAEGSGHGGFALAILLCSVALGTTLLVRFGQSASAQRASTWPIAASAVGYFTGHGALLVAVAVTLLFVLLEGRGESRGGGLIGAGTRGASVLRIKAQSIRGLIGRIEGALDRLRVKPLYMAVDHDGKQKELTIVAEFSAPPDFEVRELIAALQEIEGVLQFAVE